MANIKLSWKQVKTIRSLYAAGKGSTSYLADIYGVSQSLVGKIIANTVWIDPEYTPPQERPKYSTRPRVTNGNATLTREDAAKIRARYAAGGILHRELAEQYGVNPTTISEVIHNQRWRDPEYTPPAR